MTEKCTLPKDEFAAAGSEIKRSRALPRLCFSYVPRSIEPKTFDDVHYTANHAGGFFIDLDG